MTDLRTAPPTSPEVEQLSALVQELDKKLAQYEQQKPVAWVDLDCWLHGEFWPDDCFSDEAQEGYTPLYTAPPQRKWQGLTDEEIAEAMVFNKRVMCAHIEAKLKEKNGY